MKQKNLISRMSLFLLLLFPVVLLAQSTINGKITAEGTGETVPFANVIEKGTSNGTTTDIDGNYSIQVSKLPVTLVISSLGYATTEVQATSTAPLNVIVAVSAQALEEVVISGLASSIKRSNAANAVSSISSAQLTGTTPPPTLDGALYGKFLER